MSTSLSFASDIMPFAAQPLSAVNQESLLINLESVNRNEEKETLGAESRLSSLDSFQISPPEHSEVTVSLTEDWENEPSPDPENTLDVALAKKAESILPATISAPISLSISMPPIEPLEKIEITPYIAPQPVLTPPPLPQPSVAEVESYISSLLGELAYQNRDELLNHGVVRFSNQQVPGTHFYSAGAHEIANVLVNYPEFQFEGVAFLVGLQPGDDLLAVHRFSNQNVPGTHFYTASEAEYQSVLVNYPEFHYDGIAYYVLDPSTNLGTDVHRFSNQNIPGTHFYTASEAEYQNVLVNYPEFHYDGIAYEVVIL